MPANLELRGDTYYFRGMINGKLHRVSTGFVRGGGPRAVDLAKRRAREIENDIRAGLHGYVKTTLPTFRAWADKFLAAYYPDRDRRYNTEALLMRRPVARWGAKALDQITSTDIVTWVQERRAEGAKPGTLEREHTLLKRLFTAAVDDGLLTKHPMRGIRTPKTTPRTRVMTREEETAFRAAIGPHWQRFLTVALMTGLRLGELLGVRPCDVKDGWLTVRPETNKTRKARRVPLRAEAREALDAQGATSNTSPYWAVCTQAPKGMMRRTSIKLGLSPRLSCHDLRRTFGTRCAEGGMRLVELQKIMGHENPQITARYYIHLEERALEVAMEKVTL